MNSLSDILDIDTLDTDGAIAETADRAGLDRASFFKKAGLAGAGLAGGGALMGFLPAMASAAVPASDIAILNFALTLEFLEAAFYAEALKSSFPGAVGSLTKLVASHEATHVKFLQKALGSKAIKKPTFDFGNTTSDQPTFLKTAFVLENTGVHAYLGQAGKIKTPSILGAAATIVTIEGRHASAFALVAGNAAQGKTGITPDGAFDVPKSKAAILTAVGKTGFIKSTTGSAGAKAS